MIVSISCSHYYYVANSHNVPLFREKNEFRLFGTAGIGDESESFELQGAYSPTDHLGIMVDYMHAKGGESTGINDYGKGNYLEAAAGYFTQISDHEAFEIYGGLGRGTQEHIYTSFNYDGTYTKFLSGNSSLSFTKLFIQPSYGFTYNWFDIATSVRICNVSFDGINNHILYSTSDFDELNSLDENSYIFLEPSITARAGWKSCKIQFQAIFPNIIKRQLNFVEEYHFSIGLCFSFK